MLNEILLGDYLDKLLLIPADSVDLITTDISSGIADTFDSNEISLVELWQQYERIIKDNGIIVLNGKTPCDRTLGVENLQLLDFPNQHSSDAQKKSVVSVEAIIDAYTKPGDVVFDNVMGTGTTAIAAINTDRNYLGVEKNSEFHDAAINRIADHLIERMMSNA